MNFKTIVGFIKVSANNRSEYETILVSILKKRWIELSEGSFKEELILDFDMVFELLVATKILGGMSLEKLYKMDNDLEGKLFHKSLQDKSEVMMLNSLSGSKVNLPPTDEYTIPDFITIVRKRHPPLVTIADIEWGDEQEPNGDCHYHHVIGITPYFKYLISWDAWEEPRRYIFSEWHVSEDIATSGTLDEAKELAKAHFTSIIESCIVIN